MVARAAAGVLSHQSVSEFNFSWAPSIVASELEHGTAEGIEQKDEI